MALTDEGVISQYMIHKMSAKLTFLNRFEENNCWVHKRGDKT